MKIEKGKLYYNHQLECVIKAKEDSEDMNGIHSDKVAVLCYNEQHIEYIMILLGNVNYNRPYVFINEKYGEPHGCIGYHVITIDQFKEFYPPDEEQDSYARDVIVQNVIQKYQQRSDVGIKKYGTTLEDNEDGVYVFLTHLQEEMMDATLYIEKLKRQFAELKKHL